ncbi:MAG: hypothetical protein OEL56_04020 [Nitrosopumilus sp.]|nr:hypothetical protein [Nitrosopumilus sp.]MDH3489594.1 hypothetical protein [Nitrosopumilus sp.]MDH3516592.1 hypothetical protein [Nitrosopumilus sp.]MDH3565059.1 hypothetical protein [Nitrosopumilus sp.]MDH5416482.1 hypothetical protein [Nitrosopumilus sp.]
MAKFTVSKIIGVFVIPSNVAPLHIDNLFDPDGLLNKVRYKAKLKKHGEKILDHAKKYVRRIVLNLQKNILFGNPGNGIVTFAVNKKMVL